MAPVPLSLWHVRERVVPVVGAGGVGSGDEADTGVKFVIANYKMNAYKSNMRRLRNYSARRRTLPCPIQPNIFCFYF